MIIHYVRKGESYNTKGSITNGIYLTGHDMMITMTAKIWQIGLSGFEPVIFYNFIDLIMTLTNAVITLTNNCIIGITANEKRCKDM